MLASVGAAAGAAAAAAADALVSMQEASSAAAALLAVTTSVWTTCSDALELTQPMLAPLGGIKGGLLPCLVVSHSQAMLSRAPQYMIPKSTEKHSQVFRDACAVWWAI
jgi:hypothetical protein